MIETNQEKAKYQKENVIVLPKYNGNPDDTCLHDLLPLLECRCALTGRSWEIGSI